MLYKIEMHHFNGWGDANWTDTKDDVTTPVRFKSITAAQAALDALFADVREAVVAGDMEIEESPQDYRIVEAHNETRSVLRIDPTW